MVAGVDDGGAGRVAGGPEHAAVDHLEVVGRQHVVEAQGAGPGAEVAGVGGDVTPAVEAALRGALDGALAARDECGIDAWVVQQLGDCARDAVAVEWVGVVVAGDHEAGVAGQAAAAPLVVAQPRCRARGDVLGPQPDLVVVAQAVAVLGTVEDGRGGMGGQQVDDAGGSADRHVPVRLRRQPQLSPYRWRVPGVPRRRVARLPCIG